VNEHLPLSGQAEAEIRDSRRILEDRLRTPIQTFAYPCSRYNASIVKAVSESGFDFACAYSPGYVGGAGKLHPKVNLFFCQMVTSMKPGISSLVNIYLRFL
jgi:hypothetical protein